jgi:hypothetical protein
LTRKFVGVFVRFFVRRLFQCNGWNFSGAALRISSLQDVSGHDAQDIRSRLACSSSTLQGTYRNLL